MAVSGSGGWIPSTLVRIRNSQLISVGYTHNVPKSIVQMDMSVAADTLRAQPTNYKNIYAAQDISHDVSEIVLVFDDG